MARTRYRYNSETKQMEEIGSDWSDAPRRAQTVTEELVYGNARMTDGADVSSRKKHREYLKQTGLAMASDFTETTAKVQAEKNNTERHKRDAREDAARAFYDLKTQRKR